jgi:hypothetical protein
VDLSFFDLFPDIDDSPVHIFGRIGGNIQNVDVPGFFQFFDQFPAADRGAGDQDADAGLRAFGFL